MSILGNNNAGIKKAPVDEEVLEQCGWEKKTIWVRNEGRDKWVAFEEDGKIVFMNTPTRLRYSFRNIEEFEEHIGEIAAAQTTGNEM